MMSSVSQPYSFQSFITKFLELEGEGYNRDTSCRVESSKASHSAYFPAVVLCICSYLLQEEAVLKMAGQATDVLI